MDKELENRLAAHRAAIAVMAMVMEQASPGSFEEIIEALSTFEEGARQHNEHAAMIREFREIRSGVEMMRDWIPKRPQPPDDIDR